MRYDRLSLLLPSPPLLYHSLNHHPTIPPTTLSHHHTTNKQQQQKSAYAHRPAPYTTGEPAFTTFHAEFKGTVDYVWFTRESLRCAGAFA